LSQGGTLARGYSCPDTQVCCESSATPVDTASTGG
jgi:hypothetical protein